MLKYYFTIAYRNLLKNRLYTLINVAGLTIGMTCFMLIALYIQYELSFDRQHEHADRIYRVSQRQPGNEFRGSDAFALAPMPLIQTMKESFPEVEAGTTFHLDEKNYDEKTLLAHGEKVFYTEGIYADEFFFDVFTYPMLEGEGKEALKDPNNILLSRSTAEKFFGKTSPLGKMLRFKDTKPLRVKGVFEDILPNQHFTFDFITSLQNFTYYSDDRGRWNSNNYRAYVVLPGGYDPARMDEKMQAFDKYTNPENINLFYKPTFFLQALTDIHLYSRINFEMGTNGDVRYIYLFASIALIILLLASINYMNLATARSTQRAREVGLRKVIGANRRELVLQFLGESFLVTLMSFVLALLLTELALPVFNDLLGQQLSFVAIGDGFLLGIMLFVAFVVGICSGLYPALYLTGVPMVHALKGALQKGQGNGVGLRNILVVGQFTAAIILAISSVVIYQQISYIQNKELGYNRDQVIFIPYRGFLELNSTPKATRIKQQLLKHPNVEEVSFASSLMLNSSNQGIADEWEGNTTEETIQIYRNYVDYDFLDLFEMELIEGRNFSLDFPSDSTQSYILNESAVKALGWESAIGKTFEDGRVIGVVKDFHFQPFDLALEPMRIGFITKGFDYNGNIAIKVKTNELDKTMTHIQQTLKTIVPNIPLEYKFMDEAYMKLYGTEEKMGAAFNIFTLLAIFIACIGSFGLVSYSVVQRTKEIGVRKILGASVGNIVMMISRDFLKLVLLAILIAIPIAWWGMNQWLENFVYRIEIQGWMFFVAGAFALFIAFLTISSQAVRAAMGKPAHALRDE